MEPGFGATAFAVVWELFKPRAERDGEPVILAGAFLGPAIAFVTGLVFALAQGDF